MTGLYGVDTRALTKHVRVYGTLRGRIVEGEATEADLELAKSFEMHDQVAQCTCKEAYKVPGEGKYHIAVMDFGLKRGIDFLFRFVAHRAGVEDDDFRLFKGRFDEPPALQGSGEPKRVVDVHLAAKRDDMESALRHREMLHVSR